MKRIAAIMITSLFVLTVLGVFTMPQNATVNHIPVPFPYAQSSPAKPYVATSNGLTYTVEPNGTYLWNGHYLRDPPVPYPTVPTIAPDGLPYGAVGQVGATGHQGPYTFTRGTAKIVGISPATTTGTNTVISTNTYWNNESLTIVGNITMDAGVSLYINNSVLTFNEPASSVGYSYGIQASNTNPSTHVVIQDGSVIKQTGTALFYVISDVGGISSYATLTFNNATIWANGTPVGSYNPVFIASQYFFANYSTFNGVNNGAIVQNLRGGTESISHSVFKSILVSAYDVTNSTIENVTTSPNEISAVPYSGNAYDTFINATMNVVASTRFVIHNMLFENTRNSVVFENPGAGVNTGQTNVTWYNDTISNMTFTTTSTATFWFGFFAQYALNNLTVEHVTFDKIQLSGIADSTSRFFNFGTVNRTQFLYNKIINSSAAYANLLGTHTIWGNVSYNLVENVNSTATNLQGYTNTGNSNGFDFLNIGEAKLTLNDVGIVIVKGNFIKNISNGANLQFWGRGIVVTQNTFVDMSHVQALAQGPEGGMWSYNTIVSNNSFYGIYNSSIGYGGDRGGPNGTNIQSDHFYDVTSNSFDAMTYVASEIYNSMSGLYLTIVGGNVSGPASANNGYNAYTKVKFENSSISQIVLYSFHQTNSAGPLSVLLPYDWNITIDNSYLSNYLFSLAANFSKNYPGVWSNSTTAPANPSFLNLTGYLGIYPSQTYTLNASNIKGESSLPVYLAGTQIASISASSAHYNLTASYSSGTLEYSLSANSASDQPISIMWNGQVPNTEYSVAMYDHGKLIDYSNVTSSANGVVTFTYNPATMPLDPVFELTTFHIVTSGSTAVPPEVFLYVLLAGGALLGAGAIIVAAVDRRRYR